MADKKAPVDKDDLATDMLLREAEEEVRRERMERLWKEYGTYLIGAALLLVASIWGYQLWKARAAAEREAAGTRYSNAVRLAEDGKTAEATAAFGEIAKSSPAGYRTLARLQSASAEVRAGRMTEAVAMFESLANDTAIDPLLRDFARLQAASVRLDTADWTEMQNRLNDLVGEKGTWRYGARELLGLAAMKAGRFDEARKTFQELLADRKVPPSIGQRAQIIMTEIIAAEVAGKPAVGTVPPEPAPLAPVPPPTAPKAAPKTP
jgi:hypothetical protein